VQGKFYCNVKALSPAERASHKKLTDRLMALRRETVESEKGLRVSVQPEGDLAFRVGGVGGCGRKVLPVF